jgi:hypothetical protein
MVLLALPPADHLLNERDRGQFVPSRRRRMMANVGYIRDIKFLKGTTRTLRRRVGVLADSVRLIRISALSSFSA